MSKVKTKLTNRPKAIRQFLLKEISTHSDGITTKACKIFSVSPMTINRHLNILIKQNKIIKTGTTNDAKYFLIDAQNKELKFKISSTLDEFDIWNKHFSAVLKRANKNVYDICEYGFTEILNNAKDHSDGTTVITKMQWGKGFIELSVIDDGIGIFYKLQKALKLGDIKESVLELSKGKVTTDPQNHTGEGIFFSSRAFDLFEVIANHIVYLKDNIDNEWTMHTNSKQKGTQVVLRIAYNSNRKLRAIFDEYTTVDDDAIPGFNKTEIRVELARLGYERYISRSQAKRILHGLEKFKHIILDFHGIEAVGQGFVDEVFRVYQNKYPDTIITYHDANESVEFMIQRSLSTLT